LVEKTEIVKKMDGYIISYLRQVSCEGGRQREAAQIVFSDRLWK